MPFIQIAILLITHAPKIYRSLKELIELSQGDTKVVKECFGEACELVPAKEKIKNSPFVGRE